MPDTHIETNHGLVHGTQQLRIYDHNKTKSLEKYLRERNNNTPITYKTLEEQKETLVEKHQNEIDELKEKLDLTMKAVDFLVDKKEFEEAYNEEKEGLESNKKLMIYVNKLREKEKKPKITYEEFMKEFRKGK